MDKDLSFKFGVLLGLMIFIWGMLCIVNKADAQQGKPKNQITVMVIDTGIGYHFLLDSNVEYKDTEDYIDNEGHGTHVAGIILYGNHHLDDKLCPQVRIVSCKYYNKPSDSEDVLDKETSCLDKATKQHFDYVNFSSGGNDYSQEEYGKVAAYVNGGGVLVTALGNKGEDVRQIPYYPASFAFDNNKFRKLNNVIAVANLDIDGTSLNKSSNYHPEAYKVRGTHILSTMPDNVFGFMTGTSEAAPQILHQILKKKCKELQ